jgi:hypothetical protein
VFIIRSLDEIYWFQRRVYYFFMGLIYITWIQIYANTAPNCGYILHKIVLTKHHETYLFNEGKGMAILIFTILDDQG